MRPTCLGLVLALAALASHVAAQFGGMGGMGMPPPEKAAANRADIPYIKCQVCEAMVKQALNSVKSLRDAVKPGKPLVESDIIDSLEQMCDPDSDAGEWIRKFDLQEDGDVLKLVDMAKVGQCGVECRTISKACQQISEELDLSDMSEMLYKGTKRAALSQWACYDESGVCSSKAPSLPKGREPGPGFIPMDEQQLNTERMMRKMKAAGMKGSLYDREAMQRQMAGMGMGGDDDEDGDDPMAGLDLSMMTGGMAHGGEL